MIPHEHKQRLVSKRRKQLERDATKSELELKSKLEKMGIDFIFQKGFIAGKGFFICDFYLPRFKLVIEADGSHHNPKDDKFKNEYLTKFRNFGVLRISNPEIWSMSCKELKELIKMCVRGSVTYSRSYFIPRVNR